MARCPITPKVAYGDPNFDVLRISYSISYVSNYYARMFRALLSRNWPNASPEEGITFLFSNFI